MNPLLQIESFLSKEYPNLVSFRVKEGNTWHLDISNPFIIVEYLKEEILVSRYIGDNRFENFIYKSIDDVLRKLKEII